MIVICDLREIFLKLDALIDFTDNLTDDKFAIELLFRLKDLTQSFQKLL